MLRVGVGRLDGLRMGFYEMSHVGIRATWKFFF